MESLIPESVGAEMHSSPSNRESALRLITTPSPNLSGRKPGSQMRMWKSECLPEARGAARNLFFDVGNNT